MIVVDTSAVIAIMFDEPEAEALSNRLARSSPDERFLSAASYVEAGTVLGYRLGHGSRRRAIADLEGFLHRARITTVPVDETQMRIALEARLRLGKGFGSPAKLNFGDCFAYALAKCMKAQLLYIGEDFIATDVASALAG